MGSVGKVNYLKTVLDKRKVGFRCGVPSFCCAIPLVVEAILEETKASDDYVVIEGTSNQVNQYGGYSSMNPQQFAEFVYNIAERIGFPREKIVLGGDHLGPLPWRHLPAEAAMDEAKELVTAFVRAGFIKIHLDTSMKLGDDDPDAPLLTETIAKRGAILYKTCEEAFQERLKQDPDSVHPVYVIGSEVPVPGGAVAKMEDAITTPEEFDETIFTYHRVFHDLGLDEAWNHIVAVVVQPGVEFSNTGVRLYDHEAASSLCSSLRKYPDIVFEGHSTDYQPANLLREMMEDGIAILKVGPALTYALREALFQLCDIEEELVDYKHCSHFREVLEDAMLKNPVYWKDYYHGTENEVKLQRKYGFSDRSRYYMNEKEVRDALSVLFSNLEQVSVPPGLLKQYMPYQYSKVRDGFLSSNPTYLVKEAVANVVRDYVSAVRVNYVAGDDFA